MTNKVILITGGAGSLGRALTIEALKKFKVRIFDHDEYGLWKMRRDFKDDRLEFWIGDIRDRRRLRQALDGVDTIIHAAALKHISTCEDNPDEAVRTNVEGSMNIVGLAKSIGIKKALAISTDKAVYPINVYGATKLIMERLFLKAGYSVVRFGNFYESRGNVFELWEWQGCEITITDPEAGRYWIGIDEAAEVVMGCLHKGQGKLFIPDMPLYTIGEIAQRIKPFAGRKIIGLGKGEKKEEQLTFEGEEYISC